MYKKPLLIILDLILLNFALLLSFYLHFEEFYFNMTYVFLISFVGLGFNYLAHLYNKLWKYASISELFSIIKALVLLNIVFGLTLFIFMEFHLRLIILNLSLNILLLGSLRFVIRLLKEKKNVVQANKNNCKKVLIIGAGDAGEMLIREMGKNLEINKVIIGIIDDDSSKYNCKLHGKKVLGNRYDIPRIIKEFAVDEVIIAIPSAAGKEIKEIYNLSKQEGVKVQIFPGVYDIIEDKINLNQIREVNVEDLLKREPIKLNNNNILSYISGKTVLITGGAGSIGSELCRQVAPYKPKSIIILDMDENRAYFLERELKELYSDVDIITIIASIRDKGKLYHSFNRTKPDVVFHAAAHKHVPLMEHCPEEAIKNNIIGTKNVVEIADEFNVERFVLISTDKAVNPTNIMGASKRVTEMIIQTLNQESQTKYMAVRFGNVLGSEGSVIPWFKKQIAKREDIIVTHPEMTRYFMTIPEASQLVIQAGALGKGEEVFVLDMGEPVKILDLAKDLVQLSGLKIGKDIEIKIGNLRPGEKLFEELLNGNETIETEHDKIFITNLELVDKGKLFSAINELEQFAYNVDIDNIVDCLVNLVPTYKPNRDELIVEKQREEVAAVKGF